MNIMSNDDIQTWSDERLDEALTLARLKVETARNSDYAFQSPDARRVYIEEREHYYDVLLREEIRRRMKRAGFFDKTISAAAANLGLCL